MTVRQDDELPNTAPPEDFAEIARWILTEVDEVAAMRAGLQERLGEGGPETAESTAEKLVLIASELATNAVRHGLPPTVVRLLGDGQVWLLDVADHDLSTPPRLAGDRDPGHGGLGLMIARRLSLAVGWYTTDQSKHVWATVGRTSPEA
ncbi:ATP-binding protein [Isoptericola sp. b515]|uniref:ATP-binding protein n=1 Tax=Isoptericola sp. b515 TaxID=3064652 RepID=UPI002712FB15|nr:ATP-binding protein [Isoptericola sp. b515]MDO8147789.1 ATP-binding protein [Isoptericola sp. b515]